MALLNKYIRYQQSVNLIDFAPNIDNYCACGCGVKLDGRKKRWASPECADKAYFEFSILKGNTNAIRKALFSIEQGFCRGCGVYDENWQADHIIPVAHGGGGCGLDNFQTLCTDCHKEKTAHQMLSHRNAISSHAAFNASNFRLNARGATLKFF